MFVPAHPQKPLVRREHDRDNSVTCVTNMRDQASFSSTLRLFVVAITLDVRVVFV